MIVQAVVWVGVQLVLQPVMTSAVVMVSSEFIRKKGEERERKI